MIFLIWSYFNILFNDNERLWSLITYVRIQNSILRKIWNTSRKICVTIAFHITRQSEQKSDQYEKRSLQNSEEHMFDQWIKIYRNWSIWKNHIYISKRLKNSPSEKILKSWSQQFNQNSKYRMVESSYRNHHMTDFFLNLTWSVERWDFSSNSEVPHEKINWAFHQNKYRQYKYDQQNMILIRFIGPNYEK